jgi:NarL family two-component system response regulator LiaR
MTVLVVEDSEPMRRTIRNFIDDLAQVVWECPDGADALAEYTRHRPDWVLMDIKMGKVDGLAATRQIKAAFPNARVIMVTSYDEQSLRDEAQLAGACGYVLKENLRELASILSGDVRLESRIDPE